MNNVRSVLFDLDGTLLDTAPDLIFALNQLRLKRNLPELPLSAIRSIANLGSKAMIKHAFGIEETHPEFLHLRQEFLDAYQQHVASLTSFFPGMDQVLADLDQRKIPWGIVTNKPTKPAVALLQFLKFDHRPGCLVCGDSLSTYKPHPAPILHACKLLKQNPADCLYIGDAATDVEASKAAGTKSLVALYGYIHEQENPLDWQADGYVREPLEILDWLKK